MRNPENLCELPLAVRIDGTPRASYTTFLRTCAYGAVLDTKVVGRGLRVHLNSHYLGDPDRSTRSTHFSDAPGAVRVHTGWSTIEHPPGELDVRWAPRECLYDHLQRLLALLEALGLAGQVDVGDDAMLPFEALARGLSVTAGRGGATPLSSDLAAVLSSWSFLGSAGERHAQA